MKINKMNLPEDWKKHRYLAIMAEYDGKDLSNNEIDFDEFVSRLLDSIQHMVFRKFEQPYADALRTYCNIAMVDPMLVEAYIGMKFEDINFKVIEDIVNARTIRG